MYDATAPSNPAIRRVARTTGILYLVIAVLGMFAPLALESVLVPGDAAATAGNVLAAPGLFRASLVAWIVIVVVDVALSVTLYLLLEPVSRVVSLTAAAFRLVYSAVLGALLLHLFGAWMLLTNAGRQAAADDPQAMALSAMESFGDGFTLALVVFGVHLVILGVLLNRSRYVPRVLGLVLAVAGVGYVVNGLGHFFVAGYGGTASAVLLLPALVGEYGLTAWLLVKGVRVGSGEASRSG